jgi:hypothetical protein
MSLITPDFSEVAEEITPGEYQVRITSMEEKTSKHGATYLMWKLDTINSPEPKNNGRAIFLNTMTSGKGAFMIKRLWDAATNGSEMGESFDSEALFGRELSVVTDKTDQGYTEIKSMKAIQ